MTTSADPSTGPVPYPPADPAYPSTAAGSFRFWFTSCRWEWSTELYRMHGYQPGEVEPTTELLLAHKHPDDRDHVADAIARSVDQGEPFSSRHRFIDTHGREHAVMVVADRILDDNDRPVGTAGFYIDLSDTLADAERDVVEQRLPEIIESRAVIEQAKGILMGMYGINAGQAFKVLAWRSQETNTKLRALAEQLLAELSDLPSPDAATVATFDHILLTLHHRANLGSHR
ncbi:PAS domain S-box-containing protein [Nocardia transvalensis]|uniref:histidine kinase n=1 Tax=Nocardia transvalensis TaxID=37333 RepID=A0A7W9PJ56_9NOCA|nr:PAS and ANTAR domain-containing protein [Nocardia transvalensis]MBB5916589.1 PAS domain S-box-containing protein [Nocardia transvalensis]